MPAAPSLPPDRRPPGRAWLSWPRLVYRSQRPAVRLAGLTLLPLVVVGLVSAVFSVHAAGAAVTLDVLIGARSAFTEHAGAGGVVLAVVGYLFVPALAGT